MKNYLDELKFKNEELFNRFIKTMESLKFSKDQELICKFNGKDLTLVYFGTDIRMRKIVDKCRIPFLKKILRKIWPDKTHYIPKATVMEYHLMIGFLEEFVRHFGYEVNVFKVANTSKYCFSVHWVEKKVARSRAFNYNKFSSYEHAQKYAMVECFSMVKLPEKQNNGLLENSGMLNDLILPKHIDGELQKKHISHPKAS